MTNVIGNERIKLTSSWINGMSIAVFAAGVVLPLVNMVIGPVQLGVGYVAVLCGVCVILTVAIHLVGGLVLGDLDVPD